MAPEDLGDGTDPLDARFDRATTAVASLDLTVGSTFQAKIRINPCGVAVLIIA